MRTLIALENSSCTRCYNNVVGVLRANAHVESVRSGFSSGCFVIDHEADPELLISLIRSAGRGIAVAQNGERVMVPVEAHEVADCELSRNREFGARWIEEVLHVESQSNSFGGDAGGCTADARSGASRSGTVWTSTVSDQVAFPDMVDEWGSESFPASDPPQSWCCDRTGS